MTDLVKLAALYKHWITADSINYHLRRSMEVPGKAPDDLPKALADFGQNLSAFAALSVWYSLLYVVMEGYGELGCRDQHVDKLAAQDEYMNTLRRFRNATFHYQEDALSPKLMEFLTAKDSELWIKELNRALDRFFMRELKIQEVAARFREIKE